MLSAIQIRRMIEIRAFPRLIARVLGNGRCEDESVRHLLQTPSIAARVGLALALQRLLELSYGRSREADDLAVRVARQVFVAARDDAAPADAPEIVAAAVAANALLDWLDLAPTTRTDQRSRLVERAAGRCLDDLARAQSPAGDLAGSALVGSIVLWQLGDHESFRHAVRVPDLKAWLAARPGAASPALRAIAYAAAA